MKKNIGRKKNLVRGEARLIERHRIQYVPGNLSREIGQNETHEKSQAYGRFLIGKSDASWKVETIH